MAMKSLDNELTDEQKQKLITYELQDVLQLEFEEELLKDPVRSETGIHHFVVRAVESTPFQNDPKFRSSFGDLIKKASDDVNKAQILIQFTGNCATPIIKHIYQNLIMMSEGNVGELTDNIIWPIALLQFIETSKGISNSSDGELTELTSGLINLILAKPATRANPSYDPKFIIGNGKFNQFDFSLSAYPYLGLSAIKKEHLDQLVKAKLLYVPNDQQDAHKTQRPLPLQYGLNQSTFYGIIQSFMSESGIGSILDFDEILEEVVSDRVTLFNDTSNFRPFNSLTI